ncbi:hypothetical protein CS022_02910 [Veronia nyctiphanis]|uniref:Peptide hydrolase n=1 Tax=Veronia nyctiphanis TaxID=1278244 RepID=A0A4Q0YTI8_9GAMM|nr:M28 family metallopeptidase [Veronia nyctiphanis]RXJ74540.1 hypothetical protein CS022_02910 [Veronia nyctiphanis]
MNKALHLKKHVLSAICLGVLTACGGGGGSSPSISQQAETFSQSFTESGISSSAVSFDAHATASGEVASREEGSDGLKAAQEDIKSTLINLGFDVTEQSFSYRVWNKNSATLSVGVDALNNFAVIKYSPASNGEINGDLVWLNPTTYNPGSAHAPTDGCADTDFQEAINNNGKVIINNIVMLQAGGCDTEQKILLAQKYKAAAVIMFKSQPTGADDTSVYDTALPYRLNPVVTIPILGISYNKAESYFRFNVNKDIILNVDVSQEERNGKNIIADLKGRNENQFVMVGAHLDSAAGSPGANNNGSGVVAMLEYAKVLVEELGKNAIDPLRSSLRLAFWGAGEAGKYGSASYAEANFDAKYQQILNTLLVETGKATYAELSEGEVEILSRRMQASNAIKAYINLDSIASVNGFYGVLDGDISSTSSDSSSAYGSGKLPLPADGGQYHIENSFKNAFLGLNTNMVPLLLDNKGDYEAFGKYHVPFGGLFSGADGTKSESLMATFGGEANKPFDPCHKKDCDGIDNMDTKVLLTNTRVMAEVVTTYLLKDDIFK